MKDTKVRLDDSILLETEKHYKEIGKSRKKKKKVSSK